MIGRYLLHSLLLIFLITVNNLPSIGQEIKELPGFIPSKPLEPEFSIIFDNESDSYRGGEGVYSHCNNSNFSLGTFFKWDGCKGTFNNPCQNEFVMSVDTVGSNARFKIFPSQPPAFDPYSEGLLPLVFPGEAFSARLGNSSTGAQAERLKFTVKVSPESYLFVYRYAVVLNHLSSHTANVQPSFEIQVLDSLGQLVDSCGYYYVFAADSLNNVYGWHTGLPANGVATRWKEWTTVGMNLQNWNNKTLTIQFTTKDCSAGGHFGYAYITAYCSYLSLQTALCEGDSSATLTGPPGFEYLWSTVNGDTTINGDTTSTILVPHPTTGSTYSCELTAVNDCKVTINTTLTYTQIHAGFTEILNCANRPCSFVDTTWVSQNEVLDWRWFFGDPASGVNDSSHLKYPVHSFSAPGNYTITLIAYSTEGCADTVVKNITIGPLPTLLSTPLVIDRCSNQPVNYPLTANEPGTWFNWRAFPRVTGPITGYNSNNIPNNPSSIINDILMNMGNGTDTINYRIIPKTMNCSGDSTTLKVAVKPFPDLTNSVLLKSQCDSIFTNIILHSHSTATRFTWTCTATSTNLSGFSDNTTAPDTLINQLLRNNGHTTDTVIYHITGHISGCSGPVYLYKVAVHPRPDLTLTPLTNSTCNGVPVSIPLNSTVSGTLFTWTVTTSAGITGATNGIIPAGTLNQTLNNPTTSPGTATYQIKPHINSCNGWVYNYVITVNPTPTATAIPASLSICSGVQAIVNFSGAVPGTGFSWTCTPSSNKIFGYLPGSGTSFNQTLTDTSAVNQTVTYNVTPSANGCIGGVLNYTVTVKPIPDIIFNPAVPSICSNQTVVINLTSHVALTMFTWTATGSPSVTGYSNGNGSTISQILNTPGITTETVTYSVTGSMNMCSSTSPVTVTVNPKPHIILNPMNQTICSKTSTNIPLVSSCLNTVFTWTPSNTVGNITGAMPGTGDHISDTLTNHLGTQGTVIYTINPTAGSCIGSDTTFTVWVNPLPVPVIGGSPALCEGSTGIVYTTQPGNSNYIWNVSAGGTITSGGTPFDNTVTVDWLTPGAKTISVKFTDVNNCTADAAVSYPVTVFPLPVPPINGPPAVCLNIAGTYSTLPGMSAYSWSVSSDGVILSGSGTNNVQIKWTSVGSKQITLNYFNENGCTAVNPSVFTVNVDTLPVPVISGQNNLCTGTSATYTTAAGMSGYLWTVSSGGSIISGGTQSDASANILWSATGTQTVYVNYTVGTGCTAVIPSHYDVTVKPRPVITNTVTSSSVCSGTFNNIVPEADLQGTEYSWTASGTPNTSGFSNSAGLVISQLLSNNNFSNGIVTYLVKPTTNLCDGNITQFQTTVFPVADVYFTPASQAFCSGGLTSITLASHVTSPSFTWTASASSPNLNGFSDGSGDSIRQTLNNTGYLIDSVTFTAHPTANNCPGTRGAASVKVYPLPVVTYSTCSQELTTTDGKPFRLRGGNPPGGSYAGNGVTGTLFNPLFAGTGSHFINYHYSNTWGCVGDAALTITVLAPPAFVCGNNLMDIRDNKLYPTSQIGSQCWMTTNLDYGNAIQSTLIQRDNCLMEKYCFGDNLNNCGLRGGLYQWDEMMQYETTAGSQGFCPPGWHIPSENDWNTLFNYYTGSGFAANELKSTGYSGFNVFLYGGDYRNISWKYDNFASLFWSSNSHGPNKAWAHGLNYYDPSVSWYPGSRSNAFWIRCLKD